MDKATKANLNKRPGSPQVYTCANCPGEITVADSARGDLITVNIDAHAKAAHRVCPSPDETP